MERLNELKFKSMERFQMKAIIGGETSCHTGQLTNWVSGGDTSHHIQSDTGQTILGYSTKGNTMNQVGNKH